MKNKAKIDIAHATSKMILLCWVTIFVCNILKFFGYKEFEIPHFDFTIDIWLQRFINLILYNINAILVMLLLIKRKLKLKEIILIFIIYSILFVLTLFEILVIVVLILEPIIWFATYMVLHKDKWYKLLLETFCVYILMFLYQGATSLYKNFNTNFVVYDFIPSLVLQIDYYALVILGIIHCFKKGGYIYGYWKTIILILSKRQRIKESVQKNQNDVSQEIGYKLFLIVLSIAQIFLVGTVCYFVNNVILEYFIIIVSFFVMRQVFGKSYHADSVLACTTLSVIVFTIATRLPLPQWLSILCNIFIGCMVAYVMYMWYYYAKYVTKEEIVIRSGMKREDLIYLCERANLTKLATDRMLLKYVEGKSTKEIAVIEGVELESIKSSIRRSRKAIQS